MPETQRTTVAVKSAWESKINWTQAVALIAGVLVWFGIDVTPEIQAAIVTAILAASTIITWILRTFFTTDITKSAQRMRSL